MTESSPGSPPVAKRVPHERTVHGETVVDDYYWLLDRDDPDTVPYLEAENAWTDAATEHLGPLREELFEDIKSRIQETDLSVPAKRGPWWYLSRTEEGKQYPILCRRPATADAAFGGDETKEEILLDGNELAGESPYFSFGVVDVSPDHQRVAFSVDYDGDESYTMKFLDLTLGEVLPDTIEGTMYGSAWSTDGTVFFYTTFDATRRPYRLWRHRLGTSTEHDVLLHEELDERFFLSVGLSRSERFVVLNLHSKVTSEEHVLPADDPEVPFQVVEPRRQGVEYTIEHQNDRFLILSNDGHEDFALFEAPVSAPGRAHWQELWAPGRGTRLDHADALSGHVIVHFRRDALTGLRVIPIDDAADAHEIDFPEPVYSVEPGENPEFDSTNFRLGFESLVTPPTVYDYDLESRTLTLRKQQPVLGGYDPTEYEQRREWATAPDGEQVPISLVRKIGVVADGEPAPCLLYGYGAYEISIDPYFSAVRLPLLDRGFVFAIAHVRGGGERGRRWYEQGKLLHTRNTFTDFVACAARLCDAGYTTADRLAARGGSAGGLLTGAVANMAPEGFAAIVGEVPFVDALNTILDPSLPLTVTEWEEWGNPVESAEVYRYMRSYSPYENVEAKGYPAILATAGLNDPRVGYHEPAKWVARLRATKTDDRPLLLKTEMGAGHGGPSGRYDAWRDQAFVMAFIIDAVGAVPAVGAVGAVAPLAPNSTH